MMEFVFIKVIITEVKGEILLTTNFSFSQNVSKSLLQRHNNLVKA